MISIYDAASAASATARPINSTLRNLLSERLSDAEAIGLSELTHILVVQPGDTEDDILQELGWSPLVSFMTGARYDDPAFEPYWSWLQDLGGWFELIHTVGNSGFAYIILVPDVPGVPAGLLNMCRHYVGEAGECAF